MTGGLTMVGALELLRDFSALQGRLVQAFVRTVAPRDMEYFKDVADGRLSLEGEGWEYKRHGRGVRFVCTDGRVVDVHIGLDRHPAGITAWRLLEYLDSLGVTEVRFEQIPYIADDEGELERLLVQMERAGAVSVAEGRIYERTPVRGVTG
jgi:hypothetical protein